MHEPRTEGPAVNEMDIALLICPSPAVDASVEFQTGWAQLLRCTGTAARHADLAGGVAAEAQHLRQAVAGLGDSAPVLLAPHGQFVLDALALARLWQALQGPAGWSAVLAHDQHFACTPGPDYCTVRGLQRYLRRLASEADESTAALQYSAQHAPLLTLSTAGAIRRGTLWQHAAWIRGAHVHDYADYYRASREEVIPLVPAQARRVLDVGGGDGAFLHRLRAARGDGEPLQTHLAELSPAACGAARDRVDRVWSGDFGTLAIDGRFDCITFLEALEHTEDPLRWLRRARDLLSPGGTVIASVPNVGHWSVIADLIEGHWDYAPVGVHCVTHLRFFTEHGLRGLFAQAGYQVQQVVRTEVACPPGWKLAWSDRQRAALGLEPDPASWDTYGFIVRASA